jgi:CubicO group peptidase (beta-lactamase class C family)
MRILLGAVFALYLLPAFGRSEPIVEGAKRVVADTAIREMRGSLAPLIRAAQEKYLVPGIALVLVRGDRTLWLEGFGYASKETGSPVTPDTVFRVGSLAKPFTALAVLQLAEQGALDIDQPLAAYLPGFSIRSRFDVVAKPITPRSLLCHHAGLPTDLNKGMWTDASYREVAERLGEEYAAFPPFMVFSYSNVAYTLLGHMVEQVSGTTYPQYMGRNLFAPLGMGRTGFGKGEVVADHAAGYRRGEPLDLLPIRDLPAHGLQTTAADLGAFMRAFLGGGALNGQRVAAKETLEEMIEPQNSDVALDLEIVNGLGWFLEQDTIPGAGRVVRHGGTTLAFAAELLLLPDAGLGVAVLANAQGSRFIVSRLAEEILTRMTSGTEASQPKGKLLADLDKGVSASLPGELEGNYATDFGLISIKPQDAKLCACIVDETVDLIPYPNGWFGVVQDAGRSLPPALRPLAKLRFQTRVIDGREVVVAKRGDKTSILGEKVPDDVIPEPWLKRVGSYELLNPDNGFPLVDPQIKLRDGQLCMSYRLPKLSSKTIQVPIRPISNTEAIILGLGRTRGETLRAFVEDGEERVRYSGFIGRRLPEGQTSASAAEGSESSSY